MNKLFVFAVVFITASFTAGANESEATSANSNQLTVATWNPENLAYPSRKGCTPRRSRDIKKLQEYVESLNADIIAFQEVHSEEAVRQVLPNDEWRVIISEREDTSPYQCRRSDNRSAQQKVAFAVKNDVNVIRVDNFEELAVGNPGLRFGLAITVITPIGLTEILNVHLKSGCFVADYTNSDKEACDILAQQVPLLDKWVEQRATTGRPFLVVGDFNHHVAEGNNLFGKQLLTKDDGKPLFATFVTKKMKACHPKYPVPIDHILVGGDQRRNAKGSRKVHYFDGRMLSDHCAVSFTMK